jgi:coenzyme F420-reducing hydrogenase delta subunit
VKQVQALLDQIGLGGTRVQMFNLSSAEGPQFAQYCTDFSAKIVELGPNPLGTSARARSSSQSAESGG